MIIETVPVGYLSQDPANARKHDEKNITAIMASLRRFGQQKPIVVDISNVVRAGNGTLEAASRLGWESIDIVRTTLQSADAVAFAIADNRTTDLSEFDNEILRAQLEALDEELQLCAGYDEVDIAALASDYDDGEVGDVDEGDYVEEYQVIVECNNEDHMQAVFNKLKSEGYEVKIRVS
jgi:ParB-like chromosome segregation protein Spo0J